MGSLTAWQILITFLAGIVSILSPCIIPILPGFIAYFAGLNLKEAKSESHQKEIFIASLFFSLGFTLVFLAFGLIAGGISLFLIQNQLFLQKIAGILLIIFGLLQTGLLQLHLLQNEFSFAHQKLGLKSHPHLKSLLIGALFAISWTPCYGPIIGGIFTLSASMNTIGSSLILFLVYSLGFTLPIIFLSLALNRISHFLTRYKKIFYLANLTAGVLMILIGVLIFTNNLSSIVNWLSMIYTNNKINFF